MEEGTDYFTVQDEWELPLLLHRRESSIVDKSTLCTMT